MFEEKGLNNTGKIEQQIESLVEVIKQKKEQTKDSIIEETVNSVTASVIQNGNSHSVTQSSPFISPLIQKPEIIINNLRGKNDLHLSKAAILELIHIKQDDKNENLNWNDKKVQNDIRFCINFNFKNDDQDKSSHGNVFHALKAMRDNSKNNKSFDELKKNMFDNNQYERKSSVNDYSKISGTEEKILESSVELRSALNAYVILFYMNLYTKLYKLILKIESNNNSENICDLNEINAYIQIESNYYKELQKQEIQRGKDKSEPYITYKEHPTREQLNSNPNKYKNYTARSKLVVEMHNNMAKFLQELSVKLQLKNHIQYISQLLENIETLRKDLACNENITKQKISYHDDRIKELQRQIELLHIEVSKQEQTLQLYKKLAERKQTQETRDRKRDIEKLEESIKSQIDDIIKIQTGLDGGLKNQQDNLVSLISGFEILQNQLRQLEQNNQQSNSTLGYLSIQIENLKTEQERFPSLINKQIDDFKAEIQKQNDISDQEIKKLENNINSQKELLEKLKNNIAKELATIKSDQFKYLKSIIELQQQYKILINDILPKLENKLKCEFTEQLGLLEQCISNKVDMNNKRYSEKITTLESTQTMFQSAVTEKINIQNEYIDGKLETYDEKIERVIADLYKINQEISSLKNDIQNLVTTIKSNEEFKQQYISKQKELNIGIESLKVENVNLKKKQEKYSEKIVEAERELQAQRLENDILNKRVIELEKDKQIQKIEQQEEKVKEGQKQIKKIQENIKKQQNKNKVEFETLIGLEENSKQAVLTDEIYASVELMAAYQRYKPNKEPLVLTQTVPSGNSNPSSNPTIIFKNQKEHKKTYKKEIIRKEKRLVQSPPEAPDPKPDSCPGIEEQLPEDSPQGQISTDINTQDILRLYLTDVKTPIVLELEKLFDATLMQHKIKSSKKRADFLVLRNKIVENLVLKNNQYVLTPNYKQELASILMRSSTAIKTKKYKDTTKTLNVFAELLTENKTLHTVFGIKAGMDLGEIKSILKGDIKTSQNERKVPSENQQENNLNMVFACEKFLRNLLIKAPIQDDRKRAAFLLLVRNIGNYLSKNGVLNDKFLKTLICVLHTNTDGLIRDTRSSRAFYKLMQQSNPNIQNMFQWKNNEIRGFINKYRPSEYKANQRDYHMSNIEITIKKQCYKEWIQGPYKELCDLSKKTVVNNFNTGIIYILKKNISQSLKVLREYEHKDSRLVDEKDMQLTLQYLTQRKILNMNINKFNEVNLLAVEAEIEYLQDEIKDILAQIKSYKEQQKSSFLDSNKQLGNANKISDRINLIDKRLDRLVDIYKEFMVPVLPTPVDEDFIKKYDEIYHKIKKDLLEVHKYFYNMVLDVAVDIINIDRPKQCSEECALNQENNALNETTVKNSSVFYNSQVDSPLEMVSSS
ncbi:hypothetical protein L3V83_05490 [Thiotrichales bacterium 19X7-9]|nr:hypothetical protein [Thiotrichales bacterium 19X7-9]